MTMHFTRVSSPVGSLLLVRSREGLAFLEFDGHARRVEPDWRHDAAAFRDESRQLAEYFAGERVRFDLELAPRGTPFQLDVWRALRGIPFGHTTTYGALARRIGRPSASRAVGAANGKNPLVLVVPCHRVIGSGGALVGFGGGLPRKRWLLEHEARHLSRRTVA